MIAGNKIKVFIKTEKYFYRLFHLIQIGKSGKIELKITDYYNHFIVLSKCSNSEVSYLKEEDLDKSRFISKAEMTYHNDGSMLHKLKDGNKPEYRNPYGKGARWTEIDQILDFQPVFKIYIRSMRICKTFAYLPKSIPEKELFVCENNDLFEDTGTYAVYVYIRNKNHPINCYSTDKVYSNILMKLNEELELCVLIQRYKFPPAKPYYSKIFRATVTPSPTNSIDFFNKETSKEEFIETLKNNVFNLLFNQYLKILNNGEFTIFTEEMLKVIDEIDVMYSSDKYNQISKPTFVRNMLIRLNGNLKEFNCQPAFKKQLILKINFHLMLKETHEK